MSEKLSYVTDETVNIASEPVEVGKVHLAQKRYLTTKEASVRYGLSVSWLEHDRVNNGNCLPYTKLNPNSPRSPVRYDAVLLDEVFARKRFTSTAEYKATN
jgi:hypothetical protein